MLRRSPQSCFTWQSCLNYMYIIKREKLVGCSVQLPRPYPAGSCPNEKHSLSEEISCESLLKNSNLHQWWLYIGQSFCNRLYWPWNPWLRSSKLSGKSLDKCNDGSNLVNVKQSAPYRIVIVIIFIILADFLRSLPSLYPWTKHDFLMIGKSVSPERIV